MPYIVKASGVGPWTQGEVIDEATLKAHPFHEKYLRTGSVAEVTAADAAAAQATGTGAQVAALDSQIAALQADRAALLSGTAAPAPTTYAIDAAHPPTAAEADATRAAGQEVIQPGPGGVVQGQVIPVTDEAPDLRARRK